MLPLNDEDYEFKTCAVVGNSGVLLKSKQGKEIDEHEKVFRINYAPTAGYEEDVGSRTDFDFVNLQHVKPFIAGRTRLGGSIPESSRAALRNTTLVLFEIFNPFARYHYYAPLLKRLETARVSGVANEHVAPGSSAIVVSPEIIAHAFKLWEAVKKAVELGAVFCWISLEKVQAETNVWRLCGYVCVTLVRESFSLRFLAVFKNVRDFE